MISKSILFLKLLMSLTYCGLGIYFITHPELLRGFEEKYTIMLGAVLIIYGLFRVYRTYQSSKNDE
jgi:hypothetical protein